MCLFADPLLQNLLPEPVLPVKVEEKSALQGAADALLGGIGAGLGKLFGGGAASAPDPAAGYVSVATAAGVVGKQ